MHTATSAYVDLSAVDTLSDAELDDALALFTAEIARREAAKACTDANHADIECTEPHCRQAYSRREECRCSCQGEGRGIGYRAEAARGAAAFEARLARHNGDVFALMGSNTADDEELAPVPADVRRARVAALDPEDVF